MVLPKRRKGRVMDDLISRSALLAEYDRVHIGIPGKARKLIEDAPSARRKGRIIIRSNMLDGEDCYCSECDHWGLMPDYEFCTYCGVAFEDVITEGEEDG